MTAGAFDVEAAWADYAKSHSIEDRNRLVEHYLWLVDLLAMRLARQLGSVSARELASSGALGLMQAVERFDPARGYKFSTFASWRIRGSMVDELRSGDWWPARRSKRPAGPVSLDTTAAVDGELMPRGELLVDADIDVARAGELALLRTALVRSVERLEPRLALVIQLYFFEGLTLVEIGARLGVTESRVCQLKAEALKRLRARRALFAA